MLKVKYDEGGFGEKIEFGSKEWEKKMRNLSGKLVTKCGKYNISGTFHNRFRKHTVKKQRLK